MIKEYMNQIGLEYTQSVTEISEYSNVLEEIGFKFRYVPIERNIWHDGKPIRDLLAQK